MSESTSPLPESWRRFALDPPRALGAPLGLARIRVEPEDFQVDEQLGFEPAGAGPHFLLRVRKRGANTDWVARQLATAAQVRSMDVGYAGLKDRHAVTTQWFTVPAGKRPASDWAGLAGEGYEVVEAHAHHRKLPRGALDANRFVLRLRALTADHEAVDTRLRAIATHGVPNYFGPQRFGRGLSNLRPYLAPESDRPRRLDEYALSAGRSLLFNAVLARRIEDATWTTLLAGDLANLDARGSVFTVDAPDADLADRIARLDVHPTGPMWSRERSTAGGAIAGLESQVVLESDLAPVAARLERERLSPSRRALRIAVRDLEWSWEGDDTLRVAFLLRSGGYATAMLRELIDVAENVGGELPVSAA